MYLSFANRSRALQELIDRQFDFMNLYRKALVELKLENYVLPAKAFLPLNWWDIKEAFEEANDTKSYFSGNHIFFDSRKNGSLLPFSDWLKSF